MITITLRKGQRLNNQFTLDRQEDITITKLLNHGDGNTKLAKGNKLSNYVTYGLSLAPHRISGYNTCASSTYECRAACLDDTGMRAVWQNIHKHKLARTLLYFQQRKEFLAMLQRDINRAMGKLDAGQRLAIRLNVYSDIPWEHTGIVFNNPFVQFYDYTKIPKRSGQILPNYWNTLSYSGRNWTSCKNKLVQGHNVATVFGSRGGFKLDQLPQEWRGFKVIDGDQTDLRFLDKRGVIVGLNLKAKSHKQYREVERTNFVVSC